jgi:Gas vesicle synthesis protein GvpL/GvpF
VASVALHSGREVARARGLVSAAFLVERERSRIFEDAVSEEAARHASLVIDLTGPWPPYDFVKMQFGV